MTPAEEIKSIRTALGLTQTALAEKLGVTQRAIAYWEAGTRVPNPSSLILARKFKPKRTKPKESE